ncbi:hypothetical protein Rxycam_00110 [Rubrobacter xylanophilus DSM 9941]|uniref:Uncharacterized protein n=1 Tax=Rubrobacter xylanophilus TaxID=49319 RepID=A0A510HF26_9ACTN|nr:hypothetical protein [Rubrobacter xylanophilus]QYJ14314.1 hypothetical protein Rxycam_00110 [Rubrobacter xylanophilus DSM 9941]BBL78528.1 hypothetical protein RxyAA322_03820 [Rubrobacter xylanophilus]
MRGASGEPTAPDVRAAHLLRISGYLDIAIMAMWSANRRASRLIGMAEASVRGTGPGGADEELLGLLRRLLREAAEHHAAGDYPAAMARMRVAQDVTDLRIVEIKKGLA